MSHPNMLHRLLPAGISLGIALGLSVLPLVTGAFASEDQWLSLTSQNGMLVLKPRTIQKQTVQMASAPKSTAAHSKPTAKAAAAGKTKAGTSASQTSKKLPPLQLDTTTDVPLKLAPAPPQQTIRVPVETPAISTQTTSLSQPEASKARENKTGRPVSYSPLPAIVIFPVVKHGNEKAFGDLPVIFAREYAQRLEQMVPETKVYNPVYAVDELRVRQLGHIYDQIMSYYLKAGRPEPAASDYLLKQLANDGKTVSRIIFVEADLDMTHPDEQSGVFEKLNGWLTDGMPKQMKYYVNSHLQVFDAENPSFPMVWSGSWRRSIKTNRFLNVTPSVYADSDSQQAFAALSREMSRELLFVTPKRAYMAPQYDTSVQGQVLSQKKSSASLNETQAPLSNENKEAIQRILQRQNPVNP